MIGIESMEEIYLITTEENAKYIDKVNECDKWEKVCPKPTKNKNHIFTSQKFTYSDGSISYNKPILISVYNKKGILSKIKDFFKR